MDLTDIIGVSDSDRILISQHAKIRMFERGINLEDILSCLAECDIIAKYEDDKPFPSCLVLGKDKHGKAIHIVISKNEGYIYLITAYYPNDEIWKEGYRERR